MSKMNVGDALRRIGQEAGAALGQINIAREIKRINPARLRTWARMMRFAATEMENLAENMEDKR